MAFTQASYDVVQLDQGTGTALQTLLTSRLVTNGWTLVGSAAIDPTRVILFWAK